MLTSTDKQIQEILKEHHNIPLVPENFAEIKNKRGLLKAITHKDYGRKYVIEFYYKAIQVEKISITSQFTTIDPEDSIEFRFNGEWKRDRDRV